MGNRNYEASLRASVTPTFEASRGSRIAWVKALPKESPVSRCAPRTEAQRVLKNGEEDVEGDKKKRNRTRYSPAFKFSVVLEAFKVEGEGAQAQVVRVWGLSLKR